MKKKIKWLIYATLISSIIMCSAPVIAAQQKYMVVSAEIEPRTDIKEWRYKIENGNLYKRLYNYTRNRWETDWIFVMSGVTEL